MDDNGSPDIVRPGSGTDLRRQTNRRRGIPPEFEWLMSLGQGRGYVSHWGAGRISPQIGLFVVFLCLSCAFPSLAQTAFEVVPGAISLGAFTGEDPSQCILNPGTTALSIVSPDPWQVVVRLVQPVRRLDDNLELPLERAQQLFPDLPAPFFSMLPVQLDYGPGGGDVQTLSYGWQLLQMRLIQYLERSDPPGIYQGMLQFDLQNREGVTLTDPVFVTLELEIQPQVAIEVSEANPGIIVDNAGEPTDTEPLVIIIRANCAWELSVSCIEDIVRDDGGFSYQLPRLFWQIPDGSQWESLTPVYVPASTSPYVVARGEAPPPFEPGEVDLPFQMRVETDRITDATGYSCDLRFDIRMDPAAR